MNLTTNVKTNFKINSKSDSDFVVRILREEGLNVINEKELKFAETYNFTTHTGKNRQNLFFPLIKGNLKTEPENQSTHWNLQINEICVKSIFLAIVCLIMFHFIFEAKLSFLIIAPIVIGGFVFIINKIRLDNRVRKISEIIEKKI